MSTVITDQLFTVMEFVKLTGRPKYHVSRMFKDLETIPAQNEVSVSKPKIRHTQENIDKVLGFQKESGKPNFRNKITAWYNAREDKEAVLTTLCQRDKDKASWILFLTGQPVHGNKQKKFKLRLLDTYGDPLV